MRSSCLSKQSVTVNHFPQYQLLTLLIQVHRALLYSVSGTFAPPHSKIEAAFSKQNWGDHSTTQNHKLVRRHSVFKKRIDTLKDRQWSDIIAAALEQVERSPQGKGLGQNDSEDVEGAEGSDEDDDNDLFDPKYDGMADDLVDDAT